MNWLTVSEIKAQCSVDEDNDLDDALLEGYGEAAEQAICNLCQRDEEDLMEHYGVNLEGAKPLRVAMLMTAAQWYKYREPSTPDQTNEVPMGLMAMVRPYVRLTDE